MSLSYTPVISIMLLFQRSRMISSGWRTLIPHSTMVLQDGAEGHCSTKQPTSQHQAVTTQLRVTLDGHSSRFHLQLVSIDRSSCPGQPLPSAVHRM